MQDNSQKEPLIVHVFSTFAAGGPEVRAVAIINKLGRQARHLIIATDGRLSASPRISPDVFCEYPRMMLDRANRVRWAPLRVPRAALRLLIEAIRFNRLMRHQKPDLVLTYGLGAIAAALPLRLTGRVPFIHFEDGFSSDEAASRKFRRKIVRKIILPGAYRIVVPSRTLFDIFVSEFHFPPGLVARVPNGVDSRAFVPGDKTTSRRALGIPTDEFIFGTVCNLRPEKRLDLLIRAFLDVALPNSRLLIVGDGPCRNELHALVENLCIQDRVSWTGEVTASAKHYNAMDVFVCSSETEQMPLALLEAMACAKTVISTDVGDCHTMLSRSPPELLVPVNNAGALSAALMFAYVQEERCRSVGSEHRARCLNHYDQEIMIQKHLRLYFAALSSRV